VATAGSVMTPGSIDRRRIEDERYPDSLHRSQVAARKSLMKVALTIFAAPVGVGLILASLFAVYSRNLVFIAIMTPFAVFLIVIVCVGLVSGCPVSVSAVDSTFTFEYPGRHKPRIVDLHRVAEVEIARRGPSHMVKEPMYVLRFRERIDKGVSLTVVLGGKAFEYVNGYLRNQNVRTRYVEGRMTRPSIR
jgi:hypothetical protein